jgi:hypothetical protein
VTLGAAASGAAFGPVLLLHLHVASKQQLNNVFFIVSIFFMKE